MSSYSCKTNIQMNGRTTKYVHKRTRIQRSVTHHEFGRFTDCEIVFFSLSLTLKVNTLRFRLVFESLKVLTSYLEISKYGLKH